MQKQRRKQMNGSVSMYAGQQQTQTETVRASPVSRTHHASRIQAGHFASRRHNATRYDLNNVRPQCAACNIFKQGEQWIFGRNLDREQRGRAEEIMRRANEPRKFTTAELEHIYRHYQERAMQYCKVKKVLPHDRPAREV